MPGWVNTNNFGNEFLKGGTMQTYRLIVFNEVAVPEEIRDMDGRTILAPSLQEARDKLAEEVWWDGLMREEYEDEVDFFLVSDTVREVAIASALIPGMDVV